MKRLSARVPIVVLAGAIAVTACGGGDRPPARVLGVEYTRPTTQAVATPSPTTTAPTEAPGPTAESLAPGVYVEHDDSAGYFTLGSAAPGAGHAVQLDRSAGRLTFTVWATPQPDGRAAVEVTLTNTSDRLIRLAGGASIRLHMTHDGAPMDEYVLTDPTITEIPPGATARVTGAVPLVGDGFYEYGAETTVEIA